MTGKAFPGRAAVRVGEGALYFVFVALTVMLSGRPAHGTDGETIGVNLVKNGDFRQGGRGWNAKVTAVQAGGKSFVVIKPSAQTPPVGLKGYEGLAGLWQYIPVKPGNDYRFSMDLKRLNGQGYLYARLELCRKPGEVLKVTQTWDYPPLSPVVVRTGDWMGGWHTLEGTASICPVDAAGVHLVIWGTGDDTYQVSNIRLQQVRYPEAPEWKLAQAVRFPGKCGPVMEVKSATEHDGVFTVRTTGAEYVLDPRKNTLIGRQRIGTKREVVRVEFVEPLGNLTLDRQSPESCVIVGDRLSFGFQGDSLVAIATNRRLKFKLTGEFGTKHLRFSGTHLLALDEEGGLSVVTHRRRNLHSEGSTMAWPMGRDDVKKPGWQAEYTIGAREMVGIAICPPKEFDWKGSFEKRMIGGGIPSLDELASYRKEATIVHFFGDPTLYKGNGEDRTCFAPYEVAHPELLRLMIAKAHELGMKVICYRLPSSYPAIHVSLADAVADMNRFRADYGFDGWYLDGYYDCDDWYDCYVMTRLLREDLTWNGILYMHCTINPPASRDDLYCPFIDAYMDFLLRGEHQPIRGPGDPYLRWVIGTYGISNAIATLKADRMLRNDTVAMPVAPPGLDWPQIYEFYENNPAMAPMDLQLKTILALNGRAVPWAPFAASKLKYTADYMKYFRALDRMQRQWERTQQPLPIRWSGDRDGNRQ